MKFDQNLAAINRSCWTREEGLRMHLADRSTARLALAGRPLSVSRVLNVFAGQGPDPGRCKPNLESRGTCFHWSLDVNTGAPAGTGETTNMASF
jgi:hypothetical protein